jgi:hypothetical protein
MAELNVKPKVSFWKGLGKCALGVENLLFGIFVASWGCPILAGMLYALDERNKDFVKTVALGAPLIAGCGVRDIVDGVTDIFGSSKALVHKMNKWLKIDGPRGDYLECARKKDFITKTEKLK